MNKNFNILSKFKVILLTASITASASISCANNYNYKKLEKRIEALESKSLNIIIPAFKDIKFLADYKLMLIGMMKKMVWIVKMMELALKELSLALKVKSKMVSNINSKVILLKIKLVSKMLIFIMEDLIILI